MAFACAARACQCSGAAAVFGALALASEQLSALAKTRAENYFIIIALVPV